MLSHSLKLCMGIGLCMAFTFTNAQITTADNGLTATGTAPNKNVALGGTLNNAATSIDFGASNSSSNFLLKKGSSNYFYLDNNGNIAMGHTSPAANLHVFQKSASQTGMIIKSHSDAQTVNTFEVQDASGNPVLKVRGTQSGTYAQAAVSIDQGNKTNNFGLVISNIGVGMSGIGFSGADGGSLSLSEFDFQHSPIWTYTNKHARWRVINNALDGSSVESFSFDHFDQPASMVLMTLKGQASQTGDMFRIKDGSGTDIFRVKAAGGGYFADKLGIGTTTPTVKLHVTEGNIAAETVTYNGFVELWNDNAIIWKHGNPNAALRFGSATDLVATGFSEKMRITDNGSVSIGSSNPVTKLTVIGSGTSDGLWIGGTGTTNVSLLNNTSLGSWNALTQVGDNLLMWKGTSVDNSNAGGLVIGPWSNGYNGMRIGSNGSVGIGTINTNDAGYKLFVETGIRTRKVKVDQATWADYVFEKDYHLPTLAEVEQFIHQNKHLPGVPSAKEVETEGLDLGNNQAVLLKKIEELTLYILEQDKKIKELSAEVKTIKQNQKH